MNITYKELGQGKKLLFDEDTFEGMGFSPPDTYFGILERIEYQYYAKGANDCAVFRFKDPDNNDVHYTKLSTKKTDLRKLMG